MASAYMRGMLSISFVRGFSGPLDEDVDTVPRFSVVQGMRHVLVHGYASINPATLYDTAINGIPELRNQVERYLSDINWEEWANEE